MPASFAHEYAIWLTQHGNERSVAVNVLEFRHEKWLATTGPIWVSDFGEPFAAQTEAPALAFEAQPLGFTIEAAADNVSTEQRVLIRLDNVNGYVADQFRTLNDEDLLTSVEVILRAYLDTDRSAPAFDPLRLYATQVNGSRLMLECEASADALPNVLAGTRYTLDKFPTLGYL